MILSELLTVNLITANLTGKSKFQLIEELLDILHKDGKISDRETALKDVMAREGYLSTGLENGLAIPHAKTDGVSELVMAFGLKKEGIDFESLDNKPVHLIFLVLSPRDTSGPHIRALAAITKNLKDAEKRKALMNAQSPEEIKKIFSNFDF
ncbi:MAG: PTS sugar transporter subunit IIA [Calditrichaceae bacterium]|nr:PTS sugar transporter subunit IIA [Calditrichaceae bacterium]